MKPSQHTAPWWWLALTASFVVGCTYTPPRLDSRPTVGDTASGHDDGATEPSDDPPHGDLTGADGQGDILQRTDTDGIADLVWSPADVDFGGVVVGSVSTPKSVTLRNQGSAAATACQPVELAGAQPTSFNIIDDGCVATELQAGASCSVRIGAQPQAAGELNASLRRTCLVDGIFITVSATLTNTGIDATVPQWVGAQATLQMPAASPTIAADHEAGLADVTGVYVDNDKMLYATTEGVAHRVVKFDLNTGRYLGWVGGVAVRPSGGARGCAETATHEVTPGWCLGGAPASIGKEGSLSGPRFVIGDGTYLYVSNGDSSGAVQRYLAATGVSAGFIGRVLDIPTGGVSGCTDTPPGSQTPGWCTGGSGQVGTKTDSVDGALGVTGQWQGPAGLFEDGSFLYVVNPQVGRIQRYDLVTGRYVGWLGKIGALPPTAPVACAGLSHQLTPTWCEDGSSEPLDGTAPAFENPLGISGDSTYLYLSDSQVLHRFNRETGQYGGWLGAAGNYGTPAGSATCEAAEWRAYIGDWCFNGSSWYGPCTDGSLGYAFDVTASGGDLFALAYFFDNFNGIVRYQSDATFLGWSGGIATSPTGDSDACRAASLGSPTPGWCMGGMGRGGNNLGFMLHPKAFTVAHGMIVVADHDNGRVSAFDQSSGAFLNALGHHASPAQWVAAGEPGTGDLFDYALTGPVATAIDGTYLYVADFTSSRVVRFDLATGASRGWVGTVRFSPTGGEPGCVGLTVNTDTAGWCTGGAPNPAGSIHGAGPAHATGVYVDDSYIYVTDYDTNRMLRFQKAVGSYGGWIGAIGPEPDDATDGGVAPCVGAYGIFTPGWCFGGTPTHSLAEGGFSTPKATGIAGDGTYLYVANDDGRISRYAANTGHAAGWVGGILDATGITNAPGGLSCANAQNLDPTPGWCVGGMPTTGSDDGWLRGISGLAYSDGYLYGADRDNARLVRFNAATGAFAGWFGQASEIPTGGAAGCTDMLNHALTPGWCFGGSAEYRASQPSFFGPIGIAVIDQSIYVTDESQTLSKLSLEGDHVRFVGWRGRVAQSPTGPTAACRATLPGGLTPDYCTGGLPDPSRGYFEPSGSMDTPALLSVDAQYVYVADQANHRVLRFPR